MLNTYFTASQFTLLLISLFFYLVAIYVYYIKSDQSKAIFFLLSATLFLKLFQISLDPFLNLWDEQMHALVAKNLSKNPLLPVLYSDPVLPYDPTNWVGNHVWLHKQPLYLWQMALSVKLFGATPFAIRLPSVICFCLATFGIFRIGKLLTNDKIGFHASLLFSTSYFFGELISGSQPTDQNDIVFVSYVTASFWAFIEFIEQPEKKRWWILMALFSGFAVLTKWLVGLLVYSAFFIYILINIKNKQLILKLLKILSFAFLITLTVFIPWQLYVFSYFPVEANHEFLYNTKHFVEALEGHEGDNWYHLDSIKIIYGLITPFFIVAGLIKLYSYFKNKKKYFLIAIPLVLVYVFFTIAATKMIAFTAVTSFVIYLSFASLIVALLEFIHLNSTIKKYSIALLLFTGIIFQLDIEKIQLRHTYWKKNLFVYYDRIEQAEWRIFCESLKNQLPSTKYVIYNCPLPLQNIKLMFYSDYIGYCGLPDVEMQKITLKKGYKMAIYDDGTLPDSVIKNKKFKIVSLPSGKRISTDTTYLRTNNGEYIFADWEGKLVASKDTAIKQKFIIQQFADSTFMLKSLDGIIASIAFETNGKIFIKKREHKATERFRSYPGKKNTFQLSSIDEIYVGLNYRNEVVADNDKWVKRIDLIKED